MKATRGRTSGLIALDEVTRKLGLLGLQHVVNRMHHARSSNRPVRLPVLAQLTTFHWRKNGDSWRPTRYVKCGPDVVGLSCADAHGRGLLKKPARTR
ncbi:hypothetical protein MRX96_023780 [Rhipicephalus microplus]